MRATLRAALISVGHGLAIAASAVLLGLIALYQAVVSPLLHGLHPGGGCGYEPSCSAYARESIRLNGPFFGGWQALVRVLRCNPFHSGGYDPPRPRR